MQIDDDEDNGDRGSDMSYEVFEDALRECIRACGGSKSVGKMLRPLKTVEAAQQWLLACLNEHRDEKFGTDDVLAILKAARDRGCHAGMEYLAATLGYARPQPIAPQDAADELARKIERLHGALQRTADQLFELSQAHGAAPVIKLRGVA